MTPIHPKLQHLLDVYGADQRRWPAEAVRQFADLTGHEAIAAKSALHETLALDQVLARARSPSVGRQQVVADRIMAQVLADAAATNAAVSAGSNVIVLSQRVGLTTQSGSAATRTSATGSRPRRSADWRAAAALAAALVLGVGVGMSGSVNSTLQAVAEAVGVGLDRSLLALNDEQGDAIDDEDVL